MTGFSQRDVWLKSIFATLHDASKRDRHDAAASLLRRFATSEYRDELEALLLDREQSHWVRASVLRAMLQKQLPLTGASARLLLAEFTDALGSGVSTGPTASRQILADFSTVPTLVDLSILSGEEESVFALLRSLSGSVARDLLLRWSFSCPIAPRLREVTFLRALDEGCLDERLAWRTLSFAASRALVLRSPQSLDFQKLERALNGHTPDRVDAIFAAHPAALAVATEHLALPVDYLVSRIPPDMLRRSTLRRIDEVNRRLLAGERVSYWSPVQCLAGLPTGAQDLDRLRNDEALAEPLRMACATRRLLLDPPPLLDHMPERVIAEALRFVRPTPRERPLLEWACSSRVSAFQYAGLAGLMALDGQPPRDVIDRLVDSDEPLIRLTALGALAALGDTAAVRKLMHAATHAQNVVLRARALRSLRASKVTPDGYQQLCISALKGDLETFDLYYAPVTSEAALCLSRSSHVLEGDALGALVEATFDLANDDADAAIDASIRSWIDGVDAETLLRPIWFWMYLYPAHRNF
ncbi:MAG: hypothetical protein Q8L14_09410 [Myxococcales bacterium]|nr:hypothetical protein [Myxococcales bacterium]